MKKELTPRSLRIILLVALVLATAAGVAGFMYLRSMLVTQAQDTAQAIGEVNNLDSKLRYLANAEKVLTENQNVEIKAKEMVASSQSYQYQDAIVTDIKSIATASGVQVRQIDFNEAAAATASPGTTQQTNPQSVATPTPGTPQGINQTKATVTLASPVSYVSLLSFIHALENNPMKMQVSKVTITGSPTKEGGKDDMVTSDAFIIGVYIR